MNIAEDPFASYKLFERELAKKGYTTVVVTDFPAMVTYTSPSGAVWRTRAAKFRYPLNSDAVYKVSKHKDQAYQLVERAGFSTPYTLRVTDTTSDAELAQVLETYGKLVVKPVDSLQSRGLTVNIDSLEKLRTAIAYARSVSPAVLVQQQVEGEEIRFTVIDGKARAALLRQTARVVGDGEATIVELISRENKERAKLRFERISYPQLDESIVDAAVLASTHVPQRGEVVELSSSTMVREGCSIYDILPRVHKSYIDIAESLAKTLGAGFVVVDIFCQDYRLPATRTNYNFIEFNTAPALKLYYACRDGKHFDIVPLLADTVDRMLHDK